MELNTAGRQEVKYFTGIEIEDTIMRGENTLFVVGIQDVDEIVNLAESKKIKHIYFGTSQSFTPRTADDWDRWDDMIDEILKLNFWVTLDFDVRYSSPMLEYNWNECNRFIPMISVKLPYINQFNYNATLKLDDRTWGATNPGVWCHPLTGLMKRYAFTPWKDYKDDEPVVLE
jgi:hypothetical protein